MSDDDALLKRRFLELARRAYERDVETFSPFLSMHEQALLHSLHKELPPVPFALFGGTSGCERQIAGFGSAFETVDRSAFPIDCLHVSPTSRKFCEALTHRDYLGALMHLGIERSTLGDIIVHEKGAYVFCQRSVAPFLLENLISAKHTSLRCAIVEAIPEEAAPRLKPVCIQAAANRIDSVISKAYALSREESHSLFVQGKVFINSAACTRASRSLEEDDLVSVRGHGRFLYKGVQSLSKKGKCNILIEKYDS